MLKISVTTSRLLPPANEVWGKVIFLHLFVILFTGGGMPQCMLGYHPPPPPGPCTTTPRDQAPPRAGGTHPAGMQSCCELNYSLQTLKTSYFSSNLSSIVKTLSVIMFCIFQKLLIEFYRGAPDMLRFKDSWRHSDTYLDKLKVLNFP